MPRDFPFRFYHPLPTAAADVSTYDYEVKFASAPDPDARVALARAFERAVFGRGVQTSSGKGWWWADEWLKLTVEEVSPAAGPTRWRTFAEAMTDGFRAIHAEAPVAEVQCIALHEGPFEDPWHLWSIEEQPVPSEAPWWNYGPRWSLPFPQQRRRAVAFAADPAVESARSLTRTELWAAAEAESRGAVEAAEQRGEIVFQHGEWDPPAYVPRPVPDDARAALGKSAWADGGADDTGLALQWINESHCYAVRVIHGNSLVSPTVELRGGDIPLAFDRERRRALVYPRIDAYREVAEPRLYEVELRTAQVRVVHEGPLCGFAYTPYGLAIANGKTIELFRDANDETPFATAKWRADEVRGVLDGRVLIAVGGRADVAVLGVHETGFSVLGIADEYTVEPGGRGSISEVDGRSFVKRDDSDRTPQFYEILGALDAWQAATGEPNLRVQVSSGPEAAILGGLDED